MGWVKLDDGFAMHPKVVGLSLEARWAYVESLCYAARYHTDGIIPDAVAANGSVREELLASGLWENGPASSVAIHDFLEYNPSREEADARSSAARSAARTRWAVQGALGDGTGTGFEVSGGESSRGEGFGDFWQAYPRKVGRPKAQQAFVKALRRANAADIIEGARRFADDPNREDSFTPHPTTWLNRDGWEDAPLPSRSSNGPTPGARSHALARELGS